MNASHSSIDTFTAALRRLPESSFCDVNCITRFLDEHLVDPATLKPYLLWNSQHYTRNLIDRTALYELVAICWESGQASAIHDHQEQHCWMIAPLGSLVVQNYQVISQDTSSGRCVIERAGALVMNPQRPQAVNPLSPVHRVFNPREFNQRAISLHIYSRPIDNCVVYSEEKQSCGVILLSYTSSPQVEAHKDAGLES